ncbi:hypothetical protein BASA61_004541 [Batrachochytrium salamandrivorans]|nr:hypothetical protein BASA61_004541 [Batrachochytrium salamandrivorans]
MKQQYEMMSCLSECRKVLFAAITTIKIGFPVWRCNWDRIFARSSVRWRKDDSFSKRTRVEDLIFNYGSETEQSTTDGIKRKVMYLQYTNFVIKANHSKDRKGFSLHDVGKREPRLSCSSGWSTVLNFLNCEILLCRCSVWCAQVPRQIGVFPPWGFVHSKLRSSLGSEKGEEAGGYQNKYFSV